MRYPIGGFFLPQHLRRTNYISDLRAVSRPFTHNLRDVIGVCLQRQGWYQENAEKENEPPLSIEGSFTVRSEIESSAAAIRASLGFELKDRPRIRSWTGALRSLVSRADALGVLVMCSSYVGNNAHRRLDPK